MNKSETIKNLAEALLKAQSEMPVVAFDETNTFLKNRYATLGKVIETVRPILTKHGLVISQLTVSNPEGIGVETILMHTSGEWISNVATIPIETEKGKSKAQVAGSNISYLRRYALASTLGIYADEDNDGNGNGTRNNGGRTGQVVKSARPAKTPESEPEMPIEKAYEETTSKGVKYGEMTVPALEKMLSALYKRYHEESENLTPEQKEVIRYKLKAAKVVYDEKSSGAM